MSVSELKAMLLANNMEGAVKSCEGDEADVILMTQAAFSTSEKECMLLGAMIKLAGHHGKEVRGILHEDRVEASG
jgi:hypothetical protein